MSSAIRIEHLVVSMVLLLSASLHAQPPVPVERGELRRLTTEDGLPQGLVRDIIQDRQGYLWFSTKDGLARSDGYTMTVFRHDDADSTTLSGDHTTYMIEDSAGYLWVGVKNTGLDRYDPRTGRFQRVLPGPGIAQDHQEDVWKMELGANGRIWTVSWEQQCMVIVNDEANHAILRQPKDLYPGAPFLRRMSAALPDEHGGLWMVGQDTLRWVSLNAPDAQPARDWLVPKPSHDDEGLFRAHDLVQWPGRDKVLLLLGDCVVVFDARTREPADTLDLPEDYALQEMGLVDRDGNLWYDDLHDRCCRLSLSTGQLTLMDLRSSGADAKSDLLLTGVLCHDNMGNLWASTGGLGALKMTWSSRAFSTWPFHAAYRKDLIEYEVLGHRQFGLFASDVPSSMMGLSQKDRRICFECIYGGSQWIGGYRDDLGRTWGIRDHTELRPPELGRVDADGKLTSIPLGPQGLVPTRVFRGQGDELWLLCAPDQGTWAQRDELVRFDTRTQRMTGRFRLPHALERREYSTIAQWSLTPEGTIWIASTDGLLHFDPQAGSFREYRHIPSDSTSLPSNMIFSICPDPKEPQHVWWVGTEGAGLARLDARTGQCQRYTTRNGLSNNVIYAILPDDRGELYLSTNTGLVRFDPVTGTSVLFTAEDGLPGNEFNRYGSALGPDGRLYFEGMEGGVVFDPTRLNGVARVGHTRITEVLGMNAPVPVIIADGSVWTNGSRSDALTLPYDTRMLTLAFSMMDHTAPAKNQYRYRMSGLHEEWVQNGASNRATFTNLDPGSYTFQVQGRNSAGVWDSEGASLSIIITPPWWGTWWFRSLIALAITGLLYSFYRYRLARAMEVVSVRDRIARDLHDEIGSTLSSVALYSTVARKRAGDKAPEATDMLDRITESTTQVMEAMNDIVWAVNADNDDMAHVVQRMRGFAVRITEAAGIRLHMEVADGMERIPVGMRQRKNLYLIFKEAMNNAVKYSGAAEVRVALALEGAGLVLEVRDDGSGFDEDAVNDERNTGGNGLSNMRRRAAEMGGTLTLRSSRGTGTTVQLRFDPRGTKSFESMRKGVEKGA